MNRKCVGCGATLQFECKDDIGYIREEKYESACYCERCFKLINYGEFKSVVTTGDEYIDIYKRINDTNDLVLFLVDIFNINNSIEMINKYINNKIILVITKFDIIPKSVKEHKIIENIKRYNFNKNIIDFVLISSKTNYNIDLLYEKIIKNKTSNIVYITGNTNSGKSTLINTIIKNYSDLELKITTSILPSTTINLNEVKINEELTIIDTPGFIEKDNISNFISSKELKRVMPNSEIRPITYQIYEGTTLLIKDLLRIEYVKGEKNSFTFYLSNDIIVDRINTMTNDRGKELSVKEIEITEESDVVVNGLCFIKITKPALLKIYSKEGVGIYIRKSLI